VCVCVCVCVCVYFSIGNGQPRERGTVPVVLASTFVPRGEISTLVTAHVRRGGGGGEEGDSWAWDVRWNVSGLRH